jgi:hypothetical protein
MVCFFYFFHCTSLCISCDKNLEEFLMLCFVLWASCYSFLSIKFYVCTWVDVLFVNSVAMVLPFLLSHRPPPHGSVTLQVGLGKFHGRVSPNLGNMNVVFHFRKPSIHNLLIANPIEVPRLKSHSFRWSSLEGHNQLTEVGPIHFEEDLQLFRGEEDCV